MESLQNIKEKKCKRRKLPSFHFWPSGHPWYCSRLQYYRTMFFLGKELVYQDDSNCRHQTSQLQLGWCSCTRFNPFSLTYYQRQARTRTAGHPREAAAINSNGRLWDGGSLFGARPCLDDGASHIAEKLGCGNLSAHLFIWWTLVCFDRISLLPSSTSLIKMYSWSTQPLLWKRQWFLWYHKSKVWNIFLIFCWVFFLFCFFNWVPNKQYHKLYFHCFFCVATPPHNVYCCLIYSSLHR